MMITGWWVMSVQCAVLSLAHILAMKNENSHITERHTHQKNTQDQSLIDQIHILPVSPSRFVHMSVSPSPSPLFSDSTHIDDLFPFPRRHLSPKSNKKAKRSTNNNN